MSNVNTTAAAYPNRQEGIIAARVLRHGRRVAYAKGKLGGTDFMTTEGDHPYGMATTLKSSAGTAFVWTAYHPSNDKHNELAVARTAA